METMNYNRDNKKNSKAGIVGFVLFVCVGFAASFYMIANEPEPAVLGQDMYIPTVSENTEPETNNEVDIYSEIDVKDIKYKVKTNTSTSSSGHFKSNISTPKVIVDSEELKEINDEIFEKFSQRYSAVKEEVKDLENTFTYKVTYNKYETTVDNNRMLSFTFYERIIDDAKGTDVTYKLYGYTIDLKTKKIMTQDEAAIILLGSTYKTIIKDKIKEFVIDEKLFKEDNYSYSLTGLEEFYVKNGKLHIMFNVDEMGNNSDYLDIIIDTID